VKEVDYEKVNNMSELLTSLSKTDLSPSQFLFCLLVKEYKGMKDATLRKLLPKYSAPDINFCIDEGYVKKKDLSEKLTLKNLVVSEKFLIFVEKETLGDWFEEWYSLFPKGAKNNGYLIRSGKSSCLKKLGKFIKEHPEYDKDVIMKATQLYVNEFALKNWQYAKKAAYFILKDGESTLEGYCEQVLDNEGEIEEVTRERTL
jgi:hypothetical protein